jgi:hypothetical protein
MMTTPSRRPSGRQYVSKKRDTKVIYGGLGSNATMQRCQKDKAAGKG